MATTLKPELSDKNEFYISKHRFYELKHLCLQYPEWKSALSRIKGLRARPTDIPILDKKHGNPTEKAAFARVYFSNRIDMLEKAANRTDEVIGKYVLYGVTNGYSYDTVNANMNIPCCRDAYYHYYRKFFWILDKIRQ